MHNLVSVYEDAALSKSNVVSMYIDFSMAFNTVDHDKLLEIMLMLGFPKAATQAVRSLYSSASTRIAIPAGHTAPIPVRRGTIQGDTLSPFLFLIFLEPLLRWLQAGGRGYRIKALANEDEGNRLRYASLAYADDLVVMTETPRDMRVQAAKIERFLAWSGLQVNHTKCAVTNALHAYGARRGLAATHPTIVQHAQGHLDGRVMISGQPIPYFPCTRPYKYLGFEITPTLDWTPLFHRVKQELQDKGGRLVLSLATPAQKLQVLRRCVLPAVTYHFPVAPYSDRQLAQLDSATLRIARQCLRLPRGTANAILHEDRPNGGVGVTSLLEDYVHLATQSYCMCKNDTGRLGRVKTALESLQHKCVGNLPPDKTRKCHTMRFATPLRQQAAAQIHGNLRLAADGCPTHRNGNGLSTILDGIKVDHQDLNLPLPVGHELLEPLWDLGIFDLAPLLLPKGRADPFYTLITTNELAARYPGKVWAEHKRALNMLTLLLNSSETVSEDHTRMRSTAGLPVEQRRVRHPAATGHLRSAPGPMEGHLAATVPPNRQQTSGPNPQAPRANEGETGQRSAIPRGEAQLRRSARLRQLANARQEPANAALRTRTWKENRPRHKKASSRRVSDLRRVFDTDSDSEVELQAAPESILEPVYQAGKTFYRGVLRSGELAPRHARQGPTPRCQVPQTDRDVKHFLGIYRNQQEVTRVINKTMFSQWSVCKETGKKTLTQQLKYQVQWAGHWVHATHLPVFQALGYTALQITPARTPWGRYASRQYVQVEWGPTWEPAEALQGTQAWDLVREYERGIQQVTEELETAPVRLADEHLTPAQRQGVGMDPRPATNEFTSGFNPALVNIQLTKCNPGLDVAPPGCYHLQQLRPDRHHGPTYGCFDPQGRYIDRVAVERIHWLYRQFRQVQRRNPDLLAQLGAGTFEEEVAKLLTRYQDGHRDGAGRATRLRNHWASPDDLMLALQRGLHATRERFASPLNCNMHTTNVYYSMYPQDQVFGAKLDAYGWRWETASQANPEYTGHAMEKAMRWAIGSAQLAQAPALTVFVLPHWRDTAYLQWMTHPLVHLTARIPKGQFQFKTCDHWRGKREYVGCPQWAVNIIVVANQAGLDKWANEDRLTAELNRLPGLTAPLPAMQFGCKLVRPGKVVEVFRPPHRLVTALADCHDDGLHCPLGHAEYSPPPPLPRAHTDDVFYTDGSRRPSADGTGSVCGAGVFNPAIGLQHTIDPCARGAANTITRAELVAIWHVLQALAGHHEHLTVATDSKASLHIINNALRRPHCLRMHLHRELAVSIATLILDRAKRGLRTLLLKVPAHTGVEGNEQADLLANEAARRVEAGERTDVRVDVGLASRAGLWWPQHLHATAEGAEWRAVNNLTSGLRTVIHSRYECRTGFANRDSIYAGALAAAAPHGCRAINDIVQRPDGPLCKAWLTAIRFRSGVLWSAKLALRYSRLRTTTLAPCPLCGAPDGGTHIALECRALKGFYMNRHDRALALIARYVKRGEKGNDYMVLDLKGKIASSLPFGFHNRMPSWLAHGHPGRPDMLLLEGVDQNRKGRLDALGLPSENIRAVRIVEVGWCVDTAWAAKWREKADQHVTGNGLAGAITDRLRRRYGQRAAKMIHVHPVVLGVSGLALQCNLESLTSLGIEYDRAMACLTKLSKLALTSLHDIVRHRHQATSASRAGLTKT